MYTMNGSLSNDVQKYKERTSLNNLGLYPKISIMYKAIKVNDVLSTSANGFSQPLTTKHRPDVSASIESICH